MSDKKTYTEEFEEFAQAIESGIFKGEDLARPLAHLYRIVGTMLDSQNATVGTLAVMSRNNVEGTELIHNCLSQLHKNIKLVSKEN